MISEQDLISQLTELGLLGLCVATGIDADGNLLKVAGEFEKVEAALFEETVVRVNTIVVHPSSRLRNHLIAPKDKLSILSAPTLEDLVQQLLVDQQTRWGSIPNFFYEFRRHQKFVGRQWLKERVETAIIQASAGNEAPQYILITGSPGTGKSAFVTHQVRENPRTAYHFLRREGNLDNPDVLIRSLTAQLRKIHTIPMQLAEEHLAPEQVFWDVLQRVSAKLPIGGNQVIWIDGLDEAFGPTSQYHDQSINELLPLRGLPPGIVFVLTSRPEGPINWINDPLSCIHIDLDENKQANLDDILEYLVQRSQDLRLNLSFGFLKRLAAASEGCFMAAVRYLYPGKYLESNLEEWQRNPEKIPSGLDGWLDYQWNVLVNASEKNRIPKRILYGVLGYIAVQEGFFSNRLQEDPYTAGPKVIFEFLKEGEFDQYRDKALDLSGEFIETVSSNSGGQHYRFFHSRFAEFIYEKTQGAMGHHNHPSDQYKLSQFKRIGLISMIAFLIAIMSGLIMLINTVMPLIKLPVSTSVTGIPSEISASTIPFPSTTSTISIISTSLPTTSGYSALKAVVIVESAAIRLNPDNNSAILTSLDNGAIVEIFGRNHDGNWLVVISEKGSGWVKTTDITTEAQIETLSEVIPLPTATATETVTSTSIEPISTSTNTRTPKKNKPPLPPSASPYP